MGKIRQNEEQIAAIRHGRGPMLVLAGPGTGKTTVITHRIAHLIQEYKAAPEEILVITFTKAAAEEMRDRFHALWNQSNCIEFGTFHSVFFRILRDSGVRAGVLDEQTSRAVMTAFFQQRLGLEQEEARLKGEEFLCFRSRRINAGETAVQERDPEALYEDAVRYYEEEKKKRNCLDFDDMLLRTRALLRTDPAVLLKWQRRYEYILVDEFQDINPIQYEIVKLLAARTENLFAVGDDDQSIYGFRGASPRCLLRFPRDYPRCQIVRLTVNYRCREIIVKAAGSLIAHNAVRFEKTISASRRGGAKIRLHVYGAEEEQAASVARQVHRQHRGKGIPLRDMAILVRTKDQGRLLARALLEASIPFQCPGLSYSLYDHWIAMDLTAYLRLAVDRCDLEALRRIANRPERGIPGFLTGPSHRARGYGLQDWLEAEKLSGSLRAEIEELAYHLRRLQRMKPGRGLRYLWRTVGYGHYAYICGGRHFAARRHVRQVYRRLCQEADRWETLEDWLGWQRDNGTSELSGEGIHIMTMHGAKGLEFQSVWIPDLSEGICPHEKAASADAVEEERRLLYVAVTRARDDLFLSRTKKVEGLARKASRFIADLGDL